MTTRMDQIFRMMITRTKESQMETSYPNWHGSPYDRGCADAWYGRPADPHKYPLGLYPQGRVALVESSEIEAYMHGYNETFLTENKK